MTAQRKYRLPRPSELSRADAQVVILRAALKAAIEALPAGYDTIALATLTSRARRVAERGYAGSKADQREAVERFLAPMLTIIADVRLERGASGVPQE